MILDYFNANLSPKEWESLIDSCYSLRYTGQWHKVPSEYLGDCGIEGFTDNGIVYQCYFPEQPYDNQRLYEYQRKKLTDDIAKLTNPTNMEKLKKVLGRVVIKEWHLVVPEYKTRQIIEHANSKENELRVQIVQDLQLYSHLDPNIRISVMQAGCYIEEIAKIIRARNNKIKLRLSTDDEIDYSLCDVEKVKNIRRKFRAIKQDLSDSDLNKLVNTYVIHYLKGVSILNNLRIQMPTEHGELHDIIESFKNEILVKTTLTSNSNIDVFNTIMKEFEVELDKMQIFDPSTVKNLKNEIIAGWLADCSLEFSV